jgi:ketosteroid isomerase-like protein
MKLATLVLFALPTFSLAAEVPADLAKAVKQWDDAQIRNDTATLARLVTDDYFLVNSDSSVQNKEEYLSDFHRPGFKIDPYVLEEKVEKVWGDAAVIAGLVRLGWTQDGKHQTRRLRGVYVWAKRDGRWQMTYTQLTRVPE